MASGWTDKGWKNMLDITFRGATLPTVLYLALVDDSVTPTIATNTKSQLGEIPSGNGYTEGGISVAMNGTDWDTLTEAATTILQMKDQVWTASGGSLPGSGNGARWAILTDDNVTQGSREVWAWWDLVSNRIVSVGQTLTLQDLELNMAAA